MRELEALGEAMPDGFRHELELLAWELENLKAALLEYAVPQRAETLARAVASLPPGRQLVLGLCYQEGLTVIDPTPKGGGL